MTFSLPSRPSCRTPGCAGICSEAATLWGRPRLTADVDVTAKIPSERQGDFLEAMKRHAFHLRFDDPEFVSRTRVFPFVHQGTGIPVDIVLAGAGLEDEFLDRAIDVRIEGTVVPVIGPEDLIITKVLAGRPKDIDDVRGVLRERVDSLTSAGYGTRSICSKKLLRTVISWWSLKGSLPNCAEKVSTMTDVSKIGGRNRKSASISGASSMSLYQIRMEGWSALTERLGPAGAMRFMMQYDPGHGDYTKERHEIFAELTVDTLLDAIDKNRR